MMTFVSEKRACEQYNLDFFTFVLLSRYKNLMK
jgi:hypothetical protein